MRGDEDFAFVRYVRNDASLSNSDPDSFLQISRENDAYTVIKRKRYKAEVICIGEGWIIVVED